MARPIKIDDNREYVAMADDGSGNALPLLVDPSTGALLVGVYYLPETAATIPTSKIDENHEGAALAVNELGNIQPLVIDSRNGYLRVDIA